MIAELVVEQTHLEQTVEAGQALDALNPAPASCLVSKPITSHASP